MEPAISLCMIAKNEEEYIGKCLESVEGLADEIILVDTGSSDSTIDIARRHGAKILSREWRNDFSEARNAALDAAKGRWVLVLDADEGLSADARNKLPGLVNSTDADGIEITVRSSMPETDILKYEDTKLVRLFRNRKAYRYMLPIHEQIRSSIERSGGVILQSDLVIIHHGYSRAIVQGRESRTERNLRMLKDALSQNPDNPYLHYQAGVTLMSMGKKDEAYEELKRVLGLEYAGMGPVVLDRFFMKISQLALDKNEIDAAMSYAGKSLEHNPSNPISMYVMAVGLLSARRIADGYQMLLKIRDNPDNNLRLDIQLDHLMKACRELLKI